MGFTVCDFHNDALSGCLTASEIEKFIGSNEVCLAIFTKNGQRPVKQLQLLSSLSLKQSRLFSFENLDFLSSGGLDEVVRLKPLYCGLTWNDDNALAGGCLSGGKLTSFGKQVVQVLTQNGIYADTAHLSRASFFDVCECSAIAPICSHTAFSEILNHPRNLDEVQIREIVSRGGLIGLAFVGNFLSGDRPATVGDVVKHIDYFCGKFDYRNLAIGSDFYGTENLPENLKNYEMCYNLVENLLKIGYNEYVIDCILRGNLHSLIERSIREDERHAGR